MCPFYICQKIIGDAGDLSVTMVTEVSGICLAATPLGTDHAYIYTCTYNVVIYQVKIIYTRSNNMWSPELNVDRNQLQQICGINFT